MSQKTRWLRRSQLLLVASGIGLASCDRLSQPFGHRQGATAITTASAGAPRVAEEVLVEPYPAGRWRLSTPSELEQAMLWGAHILITHRDAAPGVVAFRLPEWTPSQPLPGRTRREAWQLAESLAQRARNHRDEFGPLAAQYSEDIATKDSAGALGGVTADQLCEWPEILDAFSALRFGEVSRVVETDYGFHVLLRQPPPAEQQVSAARLVIAYDQAPWLRRFLGYRPIPSRSRAEAFELARRLYLRLQSNPEDFEPLVREYSDHRDALRAGDFGVWSTREPTPFPREIAALAPIEVGAVAAPIDSPFGVEILKRTPDRPRTRFAMTAIEQNFDPRLPESNPDSRAAVRGNLAALIPGLSEGAANAGPDAHFDQRRVSWTEGRGDAADEMALRKLEFGALATEPVERGSSFAVVRRLAPEAEPVAAVRLDLPTPGAPDLEYWLSRYGSKALFAEVEQRALSTRALSFEKPALIRKLSEYGTRIEQARSVEAAQVLVRGLKVDASRQLGSERGAEYLNVLTGYIEERLMRVTPHSGRALTVDGLPLRRWPAL
jgi:hypothetical protein